MFTPLISSVFAAQMFKRSNFLPKKYVKMTKQKQKPSAMNPNYTTSPRRSGLGLVMPLFWSRFRIQMHDQVHKEMIQVHFKKLLHFYFKSAPNSKCLCVI